MTAYGPWLTGTSYVTNDLVGYTSGIWKAKQNNSAHAPAAGAFWALIRPPGEQGTWLTGSNYCVGDLVEYRGGVWTCATANTGHAPSVGANWTLVQQAPFNAGQAAGEMKGQVRGVDRLPVYATSGRPGASASGEGAAYYDHTLGKPGFSNGTVWKDAGGTTI
jgi:hypothetical protein